MIIVSPDIGETAIKKRHDAVKKSLTDFGGEIFFEDVWGLRDLAYSIKKQDQGYYIVMDVNLDPEKIKDLDRMLRLEPEILRHLLMKLPNIYQPKTQAEMDADVEKMMPEAPKEERKPKMGFVRKMEAPKEQTKVEMKEEKEEAPTKAKTSKAPKKNEETEESPKKTTKKKEESKKSLEDIDAKLDSILSNPDINF